MKLLHFALLSEAQYFIEKLKATKINSIPKIYKSDDFYILIGGVGKISTISSLEEFFKNYKVKKAFNIGVVGCSSKDIEIGKLFIIDKNIELITVESPQINNQTNSSFTLYDMEAKYFKEICYKYLNKNSIKIIKIVSDYLNQKRLSKEFIKKLIIKNYIQISKNIE